MSEQAKIPNPFDLLLEQIRAVVREEITAGLQNGNGRRSAAEKDWLRAEELAELYGLPKTWFEERGRSGDIARTKPGRYVLFKKRDVEEYLEKNKKSN
jgi:excisionase family DNA binding protein